MVRLPLVRAFTTSSHTKHHLDHILIRVHDAAGNEGWGECASASDPYYCSETSETSWHILRDFLIPDLLGVAWDHPNEAAATWAKVRGNNFAKAGLEMACWDLMTRVTGTPLAALLGGTRAEIHSGVSLGIEPTVQGIIDTISAYLDQGYARVKMKIGPGRDLAYLRGVREHWPDLLLMADANSAYSLDNPDDVAALRAMDTLDLMMIEQPLADDDIVDHARLQALLKTPICLDESIHSVHDARKALDLGSCRIINIKVSRLGGLSEARRVHDLCLARAVPGLVRWDARVWHWSRCRPWRSAVLCRASPCQATSQAQTRHAGRTSSTPRFARFAAPSRSPGIGRDWVSTRIRGEDSRPPPYAQFDVGSRAERVMLR